VEQKVLNLLDKWESNYIKQLKDSGIMAWGDEEAKLRYPKHSWIYNKFLLSKYTNVETFDLQKELPNVYPVIVKPIENLFGLSKGCYIAESPLDIEDYAGFMAQKYLYGIQYTSDMAISKGEIKAHYTFITNKSKYDEITCFVSTPFLPYKVRKKVEQILHDYTGIVNVEYIEENIIEIHLRPSLQFYDICGNFIKQMPEFVKNGTIPKVKFEQTYSKVFRTRFDGFVKKVIIPENKPKEIRSVQFCWEDKYKLSETDPSMFRKRYMVINGTSLPIINNYGKMFKVILEE
jgi:hypothetical protein